MVWVGSTGWGELGEGWRGLGGARCALDQVQEAWDARWLQTWVQLAHREGAVHAAGAAEWARRQTAGPFGSPPPAGPSRESHPEKATPPAAPLLPYAPGGSRRRWRRRPTRRATGARCAGGWTSASSCWCGRRGRAASTGCRRLRTRWVAGRWGLVAGGWVGWGFIGGTSAAASLVELR